MTSLRKTLFVAFLGFVICGAGVAQANSFSSVTTGSWNDGATWGHASPGSPGTDYPSTGDSATVNNGHGVTLGANADAASLTMLSSSGVITNGFTLTVSAASGLAISAGATLRVDTGMLLLTGATGSHSIDGEVRLESSSSTLRLSPSSASSVVTFASSNASGKITGRANAAKIDSGNSNLSRFVIGDASNLMLLQGSLQVKADMEVALHSRILANDGTTASSRDTLELGNSRTFTGAGEWKAARSIGSSGPAILKFAAGVTATAPSGPFTVNADSVAQFDASFTTSGHISFSGGKIVVAQTMVATFN